MSFYFELYYQDSTATKTSDAFLCVGFFPNLPKWGSLKALQATLAKNLFSD